MYNYLKERNQKRFTRTLRVRKKLKGSAERPRLSIFKSNKHFYAQIIDDESSKTLVSYSTLAKDLKGTETAKLSKESAKVIGEKLAAMAKEKNINQVIFDRGRFKYHGIIAQFADAAREHGLKF